MEGGQKLEYTVPKLAQSIRLDKWLLDEGPNSSAAGQRILSRTQIVKLIDNGGIRVNGAVVKKSYKVRFSNFESASAVSKLNTL
jgi:ribosomal 50S subunit-recycling heat shock protein